MPTPILTQARVAIHHPALLARLAARAAGSGWTAATFAAAHGEPECLALLIQAQCALDVQDKNGWAPAMHAAFGAPPECSQCLRMLLDAGCDIDLLSRDGISLREAAKHDRKALVDEARARRQADHLSSELPGTGDSPGSPRL